MILFIGMMSGIENKYYTPEIEEFCVGFEYEELSNVGSWYKTQFGDNNGEYNNELSECYWNITHDKIRVKYLDKEDIESLGFKVVSEYQDAFTFVRNDVEIKFNIVKDRENYIWINIRRLKGEILKTYFSGYLKNKTELKKLLKQLNIL